MYGLIIFLCELCFYVFNVYLGDCHQVTIGSEPILYEGESTEKKPIQINLSYRRKDALG